MKLLLDAGGLALQAGKSLKGMFAILRPAGRSVGVGPAGVKNSDSVVRDLVSVG